MTPLGAVEVGIIARCAECGWVKRYGAVRLGKVLGLPKSPRCPRHGVSPVRIREIRGTQVDSVECGPRCWKAHTPSCRCSCGGTQHGTRI